MRLLQLLVSLILTTENVSAFSPSCPLNGNGVVIPSSLSRSNTKKSFHPNHISSCSKTQLFESSSIEEGLSTEVDVDALLKYHGSIAIQMGLICLLFKGFDTVYDVVLGSPESIPTLALFPIFYALSLKSRVFNPLDNERPNIKKAIEGSDETEDEPPSRGFNDRTMPSWTPPGIVFPIMWVLIIGSIRAYTAALVWQNDGHQFFHPALLALMFHLSVGDVWNTMNNRERRFGAAVTGVLCVTLSAANAAYQFYTVDEFAGNLLGSVPMIWFAVATSLITDTWKINPSPDTGEPEPLYPFVRDDVDKQTRFAWFN